jgi:hypothetical protein
MVRFDEIKVHVQRDDSRWVATIGKDARECVTAWGGTPIDALNNLLEACQAFGLSIEVHWNPSRPDECKITSVRLGFSMRNPTDHGDADLVERLAVLAYLQDFRRQIASFQDPLAVRSVLIKLDDLERRLKENLPRAGRVAESGRVSQKTMQARIGGIIRRYGAACGTRAKREECTRKIMNLISPCG